MKYTENNLYGLKVVHKDGNSRYDVYKEYKNRYNNWTGLNIQSINEWIRDGIWIVEQHSVIEFEIY